MRHIHQEEALTVLRAQPFTAEEMLLIEAAADALFWEEIESEIKDLQNPATAEKAKDAMFEKIGAPWTAEDSEKRPQSGRICLL